MPSIGPMGDWAVWVAGASLATLIAATFWLMFREGSPRARPWASDDGNDEEIPRRERKDTADEDGAGGGGGNGGGSGADD